MLEVKHIHSITGEYDLIQLINSGSEGTVFKVRSKTDRQIYALKKFHKVRGQSKIPQTLNDTLLIMESINSDYITTIAAIFEEETTKRIYSLMGYCGIDLLSLINIKMCKDIKFTKTIMKQIILAEKSLQDNNIVHRDIKPSNILLTPNGKVKFCDFGFSTHIDKPRNFSCSPYTVLYRPPEVFLGEETPMISSDIWSIGCVFYQMVTRNIPFQTSLLSDSAIFSSIINYIGTPTDEEDISWKRLPNSDLLTKISWSQPKLTQYLDATIPEDYAEIKEVLNRIFNFYPEKRPTLDDLLNHPFFDETDVQSEKNKFIPLKYIQETHSLCSKKRQDLDESDEPFIISRPEFPELMVKV